MKDIEGAPVCDACFEGEHDECIRRGCMCIDMEHDEED